MKYTKVPGKWMIATALFCLSLPASAEPGSTSRVASPTPIVHRNTGSGQSLGATPNNAAQPAGSKGGVEADVKFRPYEADLQRRIKRAWFPERGHESDVTVVKFKIQSDGRESDLRIVTSSGYPPSDKAALKAVENASPFRRLPVGAGATVDIQFTFDHGVFTGQNGGNVKRL